MSTRILVVEDNPANMELIVYLLQAFGHETCCAHDGGSAIATARSESPDLILCDVNLPRRDGYGVIQDLRNDPRLGHIPVIAVTALAMVGDRERLLAAGFDGYISKPIDPEVFVQTVERFFTAGPHRAGFQENNRSQDGDHTDR